jgi:hypothetical protein
LEAFQNLDVRGRSLEAMVGSGSVARTAVSSAKVAVVVSGEVKKRAKDTALRQTGINAIIG